MMLQKISQSWALYLKHVKFKFMACNIFTGFCTYGYKNEFYSSKCDKTCSLNCTNGCDRINGLWNSECIFGKFGADCLKTCGAECISGCNQSDGSCTCKTGWQGRNCDESSQTHYGQRCNKLCSLICLNGVCFSNNGSCKEGCDINLYETNRLHESNSFSNTESALYGVATVFQSEIPKKGMCSMKQSEINLVMSIAKLRINRTWDP
ncbi:multiple epidermal growth factor-like domains protein 10 [Saccostrea cucullata]|uniref:multiple epidermal growth factor-like domains protein 10 n=1 Tax=Saccostrea cuccullata TaxID=36930 RepID=UPI002ED6AC17